MYSEPSNTANNYRVDQKNEIDCFTEKCRVISKMNRDNYFSPDFSSIDNYKKSVEGYRSDLVEMWGYPLTKLDNFTETPVCHETFVARDELGEIYRMVIEVGDGLSLYGLYFKPVSDKPLPLVISQHGGAGTPEMCSFLFDWPGNNYGDMTRKVLRRNFAVFAPQLLLWTTHFGPETDRNFVDRDLKQLGSSITAVEIFKLTRAIDYFQTRSDIIKDDIRMVGLSYGGFYALALSAFDTRIKKTVSSCFFNNRIANNWQDWCWFNSANKILDAEMVGLICPRPLFIDVGASDDLFNVEYAKDEYTRARLYYEKLGISNDFVFSIHEGGHEIPDNNIWLDFLTIDNK